MPAWRLAGVAVLLAWLGTAQAESPASATSALARQVIASSDHGNRPFAIVDKQAAVLSVFHADGSLAGASPALLGRTPGDHSVAGVGARTQAGRLQPGDETTPAGRFDSLPGRNLDGEAVVWIDHGAALAIHRLRPDAAMPDRARRLSSADPRDNRASAGCVVVPADFYLAVVQPVLGRARGTVYVMPEAAH
jgi:hypothetical protein